MNPTVMTSIDPTTFWLLITITVICAAGVLLKVRRYRRMACLTEEQRNRVEAQRLMLRFCNNPTKRTYDAAWDFIYSKDVVFGDLHWPLVQRFTRTAVTAHFSTMEVKA